MLLLFYYRVCCAQILQNVCKQSKSTSLTISSNISLIAEMQRIKRSGPAVVYCPVGETFGICCNNHKIQ